MTSNHKLPHEARGLYIWTLNPGPVDDIQSESIHMKKGGSINRYFIPAPPLGFHVTAYGNIIGTMRSVELGS